MFEFTLRVADGEDLEFMTEMVVAAVNWPEGRRVERAEILADHRLVHYVSGWPGSSDMGVIAEVNQQPIGAAWLCHFTASDPGFGFVAADVPELSMAVVAGHRRRGVGRALLTELLHRAAEAGAARVSLSVEHGNPARDLYRSEGFRVVGGDDHADTMLKTL